MDDVPMTEESLAEWLREQLVAFDNNELSEDQIKALERIPGWNSIEMRRDYGLVFGESHNMSTVPGWEEIEALARKRIEAEQDLPNPHSGDPTGWGDAALVATVRLGMTDLSPEEFVDQLSCIAQRAADAYSRRVEEPRRRLKLQGDLAAALSRSIDAW